MQASIRKIFGFRMAAAVCLLGLFIAHRVWDKHQMVRVALEWGRLAPWPTSAEHFAICREGSMFTRAFRASFSAPLTDIDRWLRDSPGTREMAPERPSPTTRRFLISPGGGAQFAEVTVDDRTGVVRIYVYWS